MRDGTWPRGAGTWHELTGRRGRLALCSNLLLFVIPGDVALHPKLSPAHSVTLCLGNRSLRVPSFVRDAIKGCDCSGSVRPALTVDEDWLIFGIVNYRHYSADLFV